MRRLPDGCGKLTAKWQIATRGTRSISTVIFEPSCECVWQVDGGFNLGAVPGTTPCVMNWNSATHLTSLNFILRCLSRMPEPSTNK